MRRVGIDLALKAPHRAVIYEGAEPIGKPFRVPRTREGIEELVRRATAGSDEGSEFILEPTGLAWLPVVAELSRRGYRTYMPKPQKTAALRKFLSRFAKTDSVDARTEALIRHVDPSGVHELAVPTATEMTLRFAVKQRGRFVVEAAKAKGRIQSWLVAANPYLADALGGEIFSEAGTAFLRRYLDPFSVRAMGASQVARVLRRHGLSAEKAAAVWTACETACALYDALRAEGKLPFSYEVLQRLVEQELEHIEFCEEKAAALEATIRDAYVALDPERTLEREVPGFGPAIAPTVEAFAGDVSRFGSAKRFAAFFGYVPRSRQTGDKPGKPRQRLTKGGLPLLKQYLFLAAETARRCDPELAAVYDRAIQRGKHHYSAVCIVAHKLLRKVYALLKLRDQARRAAREGGTVPEVTYRLCDPETGEILSLRAARAWIADHYPSKAEKQRRRTRKAVQSAPQTSSMAQTGSRPNTGSSEDATNEDRGAPPKQALADFNACGKAVDNYADNPLKPQANNSLDVT